MWLIDDLISESEYLNATENLLEQGTYGYNLDPAF